VNVLSSVFRAKFVHGLRKAFGKRKLIFPGSLAPLANPKRFAAFLDSLFPSQWVVYAKPAFGAPTQVLRYLGRYTHRVAISNHRLLDFDGERVTFRWRDYAHGTAVRNPRHYPSIRIAGPCPRASDGRSEATRGWSNGCRQEFHMAVSALPWRNADRTQSLRPPIGILVQTSRQLVEHRRRRGSLTCHRARAHMCLCSQADLLPQHGDCVLPAITRRPDFLTDFLKRFFSSPTESFKDQASGSIARPPRQRLPSSRPYRKCRGPNPPLFSPESTPRYSR